MSKVKTTVKIGCTAYTKVAFHALRYPHCPVYGLLIGTPKNTNGVVSVTDAVPLLHSHALSTFTEAGLEAAHDAFCGGESSSVIVGLYWAPEIVTKKPATPEGTCGGAAAARIAERIAANGAGNLLILEIDNVAISATPHRACLNAFAAPAGFTRGIRRDLERADIEYSLEEAGASTIGFYLENVLKENPRVFQKITDFEALLVDPSLDWTNAFVHEL